MSNVKLVAGVLQSFASGVRLLQAQCTIIAIIFIMVENIITIIIIFINVKKNITTRAPSELRISEFTLIFSINSRLLADILSYLGNGSNSS